MTHRVRFLLAAAMAFGCSNSQEHPPEYTAPGIDNPRSCSEVRKGSTDGNQLLVDGVPANCPTSGLICPLQGASGFDGFCSGNDVPVGLCQSTQWALGCVPEPDAGAQDAAQDSGGAG